ncbi:MAG: helix-turn-helix transcriptional regulator [Planctomycetota bacterium]
MSVPRIHVISTDKVNNEKVATSAREIEEAIQIVEHENNEQYLAFKNTTPDSTWEVIVTDQVKITMPAENSGKFTPVIHFSDEFTPLERLTTHQKNGRGRWKILIDDIKEHLEEAIASAKQFIRLKSSISNFSELDDRERSVVMMAADGVPNKTIARRLNVSIKTIEHCRRKAYLKLDVKSSAEVASLVTFEKFFCVYDQQSHFGEVTTSFV